LDKVFAILVTYFPDLDELNVCVENLSSQCDKVIICNNSDDDIQLAVNEKVKVFNFGENTGIAFAQSVGMQWAFENGADFIMQMDQDSLLENTTVKTLITTYHCLSEKGYKVGLVGPRHYDKVTTDVDEKRLPKGNQIEGTTCEVLNHTISSASLIPKKAFEVVGNMEVELFIDLVDWEYCWRMKKFGYLSFRDNSILLGHRVGDGCQKILGNKIDARKPAPIRHYYHTRNVLLMVRRSYVPLSFKCRESIKLCIKFLIYRFIFDDGAIRMHYLWKGFKDGIKNKYGKIT
jgi:rhamnosyltransferase